MWSYNELGLTDHSAFLKRGYFITSNRTDSPSPHLVEKVSDPLGDHKNDHYRDAEADVTSGFHQDYSQAYCHTHNTSCVEKKEKKLKAR